MAANRFKYIITGAGLAGCWAIDGIRQFDKTGPILLIGDETHLTYDRPPLTKKLWFGKKKVEDIFVHPKEYFSDNGVEVLLDTMVFKVEPQNKIIECRGGKTFQYEKLLLATGGRPRRLGIEGGNLKGIYYYRYLDDFIKLRAQISAGTKVLVIGGGFIGSEIAASLKINNADVTMLVRGTYLTENVFPRPLGNAITDDYRNRGISFIWEDDPLSIVQDNQNLVTRTKKGRQIVSDVIIAGIGIEPEIQLAKSANLKIENGITVNDFLQSSDPDIYAAGDNAYFPYRVFGRQMRVEHWDNAIQQGKTAGMNMAGARTTYSHMPYFFSDLFDFGYEAVGLVSSKLEIFADWQKENNTGVVYYLDGSRIVGAMMCNVWDKVDAARDLIKSNKKFASSELKGAIK